MAGLTEYAKLPLGERRKIEAWLVEQASRPGANQDELLRAAQRRWHVQQTPSALAQRLQKLGLHVPLHAPSAARNGHGGQGAVVTDVDSGEPKVDPVVFAEHAQQFLAQHKLLPEIPGHVLATRREDMQFDTAQEGVALFSDLHYYSRVDRRATNGLGEYNIDIARERLTRWRDGILRFTQMSQLVVSLDTLHLFALGDDMEGHGSMFKSQALQMSESIIYQVLGFVEDMTQVVLGLLARYKHVKIYKVYGNHGRVTARARESYGPDNFETMAWQIIGERIRAATGGEWRTTENGVQVLEGGQIDLYIHTGFEATVSILNHSIVARHGHGLGGFRTYTGYETTKHFSNSIHGRISNYFLVAHRHFPASMEGELKGEIIQNGCFVGPSLLSLEMKLPAANLPSQEFMLFHPRYGKTHHYRVHLASVDEVRKIEWIGE